MQYLLKFWDKKEMSVSDEIGEKVKYAKENKIECVRIGDGIYETKAISYVEPIKGEIVNLERGDMTQKFLNKIKNANT